MRIIVKHLDCGAKIEFSDTIPIPVDVIRKTKCWKCKKELTNIKVNG